MPDPTPSPPRQAPDDQSSATPPNWPGIPGRSAEHERSPDSPDRRDKDADVTEQQRELERQQR